MSPTPAPKRRVIRFDARLLIGIALVVASVGGVYTVVSASDVRVPVYAAAATLRLGDRLDAEDLIERHVSLDGADDLYLVPGTLPTDGVVVSSTVRAGELVPLSAVASSRGDSSTSVVLELTGRVSASVVPGSAVDVWSATAISDGSVVGGFGPPVVLVPEAIVVEVLDDAGFVSASDGDSVEVLVPRSRVARLLSAIANGDALAIVPAGIRLGDR